MMLQTLSRTARSPFCVLAQPALSVVTCLTISSMSTTTGSTGSGESSGAYSRKTWGLVAPVHVTEDAVEVRVGLLDPLERLVELHANVDGRVVHVFPVATVRDEERVVVRLDLVGEFVTPLSKGLRVPVVPGVADPLEEDREVVGLEIARVDRAAECVSCAPQCCLELLLGDLHSVLIM